MADKSVFLFKLSSMVDCVGELLSEDEDCLIFRKLRVLQYQQVGAEMRIGFVNFMIPAEDADITVQKAHVVCFMLAPPRITDGYVQATSPIQLARTLPNEGRGKLIDIKPN